MMTNTNNGKISLYIDESGKPDFDDIVYRNFLLTGVVIPDIELEVISGYFSYIKRKYNFPLDKPFHTYELLEEPQTRLNLSAAKSFVLTMSEFLLTCPIKIFLISTDKITFQKKYKKELEITKRTLRPDNKGTIYFLSAYKQFQLFIDYLKKNKWTGNIYADSRYNLDRDLLDAFLKIRDAQLKGGVINPYGIASKQLLTSLTFANKFSLNAGLELADFVSFTSFAKIQRKLSKFNDIKLNNSWKAIEDKLVRGKTITITAKLVKQFCQ